MITLTEQMIRDFGLTGAMAGEIATPEDIAIMNMNAATQPTDPMSASLRPRISPPKPEAASGGQAVPTPPPVTGTAPKAPTPPDPSSMYNDDMRRILRFAAIKDAGMALQGKEGNAVATVMGDITKRQDMARKASAVKATAAANAALMQQAFGGASGMSMSGATPQALRAQIDTLSQLAFSNPAMAPAISARIQVLKAEAERLTDANKEIANSEMMLTNIDNLLNDPALGQALGIEGFLREPFVKLKLDEETGRVKGRLNQIKGAVFLQAFEALKGGGQITELEGIKAEQARARLDTAVSEEDFRIALQELRFYTEQGIRRLKGEQIPDDTLYEDSKKQSDPLGIRG